MYSRWFNAAVVLLWLTTMTWLVTEKVLPPLVLGEPPSSQTVLEAQRNEPPVGWTMRVDGEPMGWAVNRTERLDQGTTQINSLVQFDRISLAQLAPGWLGTLVDSTGEFGLQAESTLIFDPLGRLSTFNSQVRIMPLHEVIFLQGVMQGNILKLEVRFGTVTYEKETYLRSDGLLADALSPQTQLPGLRIGQRWTVPVYSPLRASEQPLEILQATVEDLVPVVWQNRSEETWLVVYRGDPGTSSVSQSARGRLWVRRDGTVIRQEVQFLNALIQFERLPDDEAAALAERAQKEKAAYLASVGAEEPAPMPNSAPAP